MAVYSAPGGVRLIVKSTTSPQPTSPTKTLPIVSEGAMLPDTLHTFLIQVFHTQMEWRRTNAKQSLGQWLEIQDGEQAIAVFSPKMATVVTLAYKRPLLPLDALYTLENHYSRGLPPAFYAAFFGAISGIQHLMVDGFGIGLHPLVRHAQLVPISDYERLPTTDIRKYAERTLLKILEMPTTEKNEMDTFEMPRGAIDRAQYYLQIGNRLWNDTDLQHRASQYRFHLAPAGSGEIGRSVLVMATVSAYLDTQRPTSVTIKGVKMTMDYGLVPDTLGYEIMGAWTQRLELEANVTSPDVLVQLLGKKIQTAVGYVGVLGDVRTPDRFRFPENQEQVGQTVLGLCRDAEERQAYIPSGRFTLTIPPTLPLYKRWGITAIDVLADPQGMWCRPCYQGKQWYGAFRWIPHQVIHQRTMQNVAPAILPQLNLTLAALWRDLCVAGETVIRPMRRRQNQRQPELPVATRVIVLPRRRYEYSEPLEITGLREWGSIEERETIARRRHFVKMSLPRLPEGWQRSTQAEETAQAWGVYFVPDGRTFRPPHLRGERDGDGQSPAVEVRARGLQAIVALSEILDQWVAENDT